MRRILMVMALVGALAAGASPAAAARPGERADERYIVVLHDDTRSAAAVADEHGRRHDAEVTHVYESALKGYAAKLSSAGVEGVRRDPRVDFVTPDAVASIQAQSLPTGVDRIEADSSSTVAGDGSGSVASPAIAVLDTGIASHPDLNVAGGKNCVPTAVGYSDDHGHGTHVAGTAAAKDDGSGVVGVAPGAPLYAVKVLDATGSGLYSWIVCGIDWVTANTSLLGIKVANMSLGGGGSDDGACGSKSGDAMHKAICRSVGAGVTYAVAAGNDGGDFKGSVPAAYDEVLTVTAMADFNGQSGGGAAATCRSDVDDTAADFSSYTADGSADVGHTIAAPGVCIRSTYPGLLGPSYATFSGTSMASPHVAGVVGLCISSGACASSSPADVISKLRSDAAAQPVSYGFTDDPNSPKTKRKGRTTQTLYYGHLVYTGGY